MGNFRSRDVGFGERLLGDGHVCSGEDDLGCGDGDFGEHNLGTGVADFEEGTNVGEEDPGNNDVAFEEGELSGKQLGFGECGMGSKVAGFTEIASENEVTVPGVERGTTFGDICLGGGVGDLGTSTICIRRFLNGTTAGTSAERQPCRTGPVCI